ncbi:MAG: hypothetical protein HKN21_16725 [Candidatus Eisenbacteria bacterium]|uniref:Uncharacterized protein n=1 Tax=Eiseniibacteriota bacterium TaxID=2212470 RepID=A0A7Y2H435_UNCEI|nr:hypothetical protein [Candidatus Eisenbacteria bacterium]
MKVPHVLIALLIAAVIGVSIFGYLASRAIHRESADPAAALQRFEAARDSISALGPLLKLSDEEGVEAVEPPPETQTKHKLSQIKFLAYEVKEEKLTQGAVPFWFYRLKGPAFSFGLSDSRFDIEKLGLTTDDLERFGPAVIIDETMQSGDRILVWTE